MARLPPPCVRDVRGVRHADVHGWASPAIAQGGVLTTWRRYRYSYQGKVPENGHIKAAEIAQDATERHHWYQDMEVGGQAFGILTLSFTVSGRDQWWCHRRAQVLAVDCFWAMGLDERAVPEPTWEKLSPHTNRGSYRVSQ